jgi:hypothetical protein
MDPHEAYFRSLPRETVLLIALEKYLYDGSWDEMLADLEARRTANPYVVSLGERIEQDMGRVRELADYERVHGVMLSDYLYLLSPAPSKE